MEGINADLSQVKKIADAASGIRPDKIHLNTAVRPPAEAAVYPVTKEKLAVLCDLFTPRAEVIASFSAPHVDGNVDADKLISMIRRHPATATQLAQSFGVDSAVIIPLLNDPRLHSEVRGDETYYTCR
jgi:wyosine [tRNA(Phe)-imidazoG37] synthetase (radical SAM superfamily)